MTTLYYRPKTSGRPMRVAWMLEELGLDYETVAVPDTDSPEHHERQPLGRVPVLEFDDDPSGSRSGSRLFDSTAILLALADRHPDAGLIGPLGSRERDLAYQWCLTAQTELEPPALGYAQNEDDASRAAFREAAGAVGEALGDRGFLVGDAFGVADIVTVGVLFIAQRGRLVSDEAPANLRTYFATLGDRPALARAAQRTESLLQPDELLPA